MEAAAALSTILTPTAPASKARSKHAAHDADSKAKAAAALAAAERTYGRGPRVPTRSVKDKKLRANLKALESKYKAATLRAKDAELLHEEQGGFLEAEGELERTYRVRQDEIARSVGVEAAKGRLDLALDAFGPYVCDYTRNGRDLLLAGRKGHVATMDWREGRLAAELHLNETVRDACWLHNNQYFAVAQKKYVYIYDHQGTELHCLQKHLEPMHLQFLPYHFLLASTVAAGFLKYTDTSTGQLVAELPTRLGTPTALAQNPHNAIMHVGHQNGTVTLWSPTSTAPLVKALAHRGPVRSISIDRLGRYMLSTGQDQRMAVWDIRMFREMASYHTYQPGASVSISDRNLAAVGWGTQVSVWRGLFERAAPDVVEAGNSSSDPSSLVKVQSPYMSWGGEGKRIERVRWCPYEDLLAVGHSAGLSTIMVPGAGEPNFDAGEANPFETAQQRQESEVRALLTKLKPEMISLDPDFVGRLDTVSNQKRQAEIAEQRGEQAESAIEKLKNRGRGRNSALRKYLRKHGQKNVIDEKRVRAEQLRKEYAERKKEKLRREKEGLGPALDRFAVHRR
ncbi:Small subunit (SSU) processome component [Ascosphaera acerosa]|nr:Small subunit (SSU) processome component [Ascosphaera acerosa]